MKTRHAIILAAGRGSRLDPDEGHKLLANVGGRPMLDWHADRLMRLGVEELIVVTGFENQALEAQLDAWDLPESFRLTTAFNPDWEKSNGLSVLAGACVADGPFWLVMSDHLFAGAFVDAVDARRDEFEERAGAMLVVDSDIDAIYDIPDANKLRFDEEGNLDAIGKELDVWDVADTGIFWCGEPFVRALEAERDARGDCNTSDAMRRLDASRQVVFVDIEGLAWQDVDTPGAQAHAEKLIAEGAMD